MTEGNDQSGQISDSIIQRSKISSSKGKIKVDDSVIQRAAMISGEGDGDKLAIGSARDVNVEIKKIVEHKETVYCDLCGTCVEKIGTFRCTSCVRVMCLVHKPEEGTVCEDCGNLVKQTQDVRESFVDISTQTISFDTAPVSTMQTISLGSTRASLALKDPLGTEKIQPLDETKMRNYYRVGRDLTNDIIIPDNTASRNHAHIIQKGDSYYIQDSCSKNGVILNKRVIKEERLREGDVIQIGETNLYFSEEHSALVYLNGPNRGVVALLSQIKIKKDFQIGRCPTNEILIDPNNNRASRHHARIIYNNGMYFIEDIGSLNKTYVNDREIDGLMKLHNGDRIGIGATEMVFQYRG